MEDLKLEDRDEILHGGCANSDTTAIHVSSIKIFGFVNPAQVTNELSTDNQKSQA